jgi:hypothetical protein
MPTDLSIEIRSLVDYAEAVTVEEAMTRATTDSPRVTPLSSDDSGPTRTWRNPALVAASVVVLAGGGLAVGIATSGPSTHHLRTNAAASRPTLPRVILTAAQVQTIATSSTAAAQSSGTAQVSETDSQDGAPPSDLAVSVTFDGANIDEKITDSPAGSPTFTTDDRLVNGEFYIYTPGPTDVPEWMHDTNSADDVASMQFPDPRSLYGALSPSARFEVVGTTTSGGTTLTRLKALLPGAIPSSALGSLSEGTLTTFTMSINQNNVVQDMAFGSDRSMKVCQINVGPGGLTKQEPGQYSNISRADGSPSIPTSCRQEHTSSQATVTFSNLGTPQSVTAPLGSVSFSGKG